MAGWGPETLSKPNPVTYMTLVFSTLMDKPVKQRMLLAGANLPRVFLLPPPASTSLTVLPGGSPEHISHAATAVINVREAAVAECPALWRHGL